MSSIEVSQNEMMGREPPTAKFAKFKFKIVLYRYGGVHTTGSS